MNIVCLLIVLYAQWSIASTQQELFLQANMLYAKHEYQQALDAYRMLCPKNSAVWYNMGNCAYCIDHYEQALMYWNMARKKAPRMLYDKCEHNKRVLLKDHALESNVQEASVGERLAHAITWLPLILWQVTFIALFFMVWGAIYYWRLHYSLIIVLSFLMMLCGACMFVAYQESCITSGGIAQADSVLMAGPHEHYHQIGIIECSTYVPVIQQAQGWYQVRYKKLLGWISKDKIEVG
jgi:hypothetical protein